MPLLGTVSGKDRQGHGREHPYQTTRAPGLQRPSATWPAPRRPLPAARGPPRAGKRKTARRATEGVGERQVLDIPRHFSRQRFGL